MESLESPNSVISLTNRSYDHLFKLIIVGDSCVGKTSILQRFHGENFLPVSVPTIGMAPNVTDICQVLLLLIPTQGIDFRIRTITVDNKIIKLQIWDTSGQEKYDSITTSYYRGAMGVLLVFDITNRKSFESLKTRWIKHIKENTRDNIKTVLIGNKCDINGKREVNSEVAEALAVNNGFKYFETSAKENINLDKAFYEMSKDIYSEKCVVDEENKVCLPDKIEEKEKKSKTYRCCQITISL